MELLYADGATLLLFNLFTENPYLVYTIFANSNKWAHLGPPKLWCLWINRLKLFEHCAWLVLMESDTLIKCGRLEGGGPEVVCVCVCVWCVSLDDSPSLWTHSLDLHKKGPEPDALHRPCSFLRRGFAISLPPRATTNL